MTDSLLAASIVLECLTRQQHQQSSRFCSLFVGQIPVIQETRQAITLKCGASGDLPAPPRLMRFGVQGSRGCDELVDVGRTRTCRQRYRARRLGGVQDDNRHTEQHRLNE